MELRDYLGVLRKQWRLVALCTLLAVAAALALTAQATPQYRTSVKFFVSVPSDDTTSAYTGGLFSQQRVKSYADVIAGESTAESVAGALPGLSPEDVEGKITAVAVPETVLLTATVTDTSPQRALAIAQALAERFPDMVLELERRGDGLPPPIQARVTEEPQLPSVPFSPRPVRNLALALVLGLLLGIGIAVLRETLDNTVKDPDDVREATGAATLGAIAFDSGASKRPLIVQDKPRAPRAEAFRQLRTNLQFVQVDRPLRSFVITSSVPKEGKSTTACNLAITLAQAGVRTVLVEGDLRRPRVADYLGIEGAVGLTTVLIGRAELADAVQPWGDGTLHVLPSGPIPPNPAELLSSAGMRQLLQQLTTDFDMVIIDAPPLLPVTDAAILATMTDGAVLNVHAAATRKDQLRTAAEALQAVDANVLGAVLTMVPRRGAGSGYGYGYGYGYGGYGADLDKPQLSAEDAGLAMARPAPPAVPPAAPAPHPEPESAASPLHPEQPYAAAPPLPVREELQPRGSSPL